MPLLQNPTKIDLAVFCILLAFSSRISQNFTPLLKCIGEKMDPKRISHHSFKRHQLKSTWAIGMDYCKTMSPIPRLLVPETLWEIETTKLPNKDWEIFILHFKQYHCNSIYDNYREIMPMEGKPVLWTIVKGQFTRKEGAHSRKRVKTRGSTARGRWWIGNGEEN